MAADGENALQIAVKVTAGTQTEGECEGGWGGWRDGSVGERQRETESESWKACKL